MEHTMANAGKARTVGELVGPALTEMREWQSIPTMPARLDQELSDSAQKQTPGWQEKWLALELRDGPTRRLADNVQWFCGRWFRNARGAHVLILAGRPGCGKTHAMKGAHRFARAAAYPAAEMAFWRWPATIQWEQWPERSRAIVEAGAGFRMADQLADAMAADLLFVDDLGAESDKFRTGETTDALCQLLSRRERKWTLATTNYPPHEWENRFDARVADRLFRNSLICDLSDAQSYSTREAP